MCLTMSIIIITTKDEQVSIHHRLNEQKNKSNVMADKMINRGRLLHIFLIEQIFFIIFFVLEFFSSRRLNCIQIQIENHSIRSSVPYVPLFASKQILNPKIVKMCAQLLNYCVWALVNCCAQGQTSKKK